MKTTFLLCSILVLALPVWAGPALTVNASKELVITSQSGTEVARLNTGTIGKQITADNQTFKVSYGKDLRGRINIILYPDPEKPQALEMIVLGQEVKISSDAVLTVIDDDSGSLSQFQAGIVGTVTVSGQPIASGNSVKVAQGVVTPVLANEKIFPDPPESAATSVSDEPSAQTATYEGLKVRSVEGEVVWAPPGNDVLGMVKTATNMPRLQVNQTLAKGTSIQTGPTGKAMISPFPGCVIAIQPNTTIVIEDAQYKKSSSDYIRKTHLNLKEGGVISTVKGVKPNTLDYQVKTPLAVASILGSVQGVWTDQNKTLVIAAENTSYVEVLGPPPFKTEIKEGRKMLISGDSAPQTFEASREELDAFNKLVDSIGVMLAASDIRADGDTIGNAPMDADGIKEGVNMLVEILREHDTRLIPMTPFLSP